MRTWHVISIIAENKPDAHHKTHLHTMKVYNIRQVSPQVAQAHYESPEQHYPTQLINYSYSKKIIRLCTEKYSLLTKLAKFTLNIALKLIFSVFLFFFVF